MESTVYKVIFGIFVYKVKLNFDTTLLIELIKLFNITSRRWKIISFKILCSPTKSLTFLLLTLRTGPCSVEHDVFVIQDVSVCDSIKIFIYRSDVVV